MKTARCVRTCVLAVALLPCWSGFATEDEPDWRARYEELLRAELATNRPPATGRYVRVGRRVGAELRGILVSLTSTSAIIRANGSNVLLHKSQIAPYSLQTLYVEEAARGRVAEAVDAERSDYHERRQAELMERQRLEAQQIQERMEAERQARLNEEAKIQRQQEQARIAYQAEAKAAATTKAKRMALAGVLLLLVGLFFYFLPAYCAFRRGHHNSGAILLLNFLLGWTFLGWVIALVWSFTRVEKKQ